MNGLHRSLVPLALLAAFVPGVARAAIDDPMPNVLLLVDSSGSMEYKAGSSSFPQCDPTGLGVNERSRWIDLVEVLTGTIQNYRCQTVDRRSPSFALEFGLPSGINPLDYQYRNPYHRPLSGSCTYGPNNIALDPNAYRWTEPLLHEYSSPANACSGSFQQNADGLIDVYGSFIRFGLMTFDTLPGPETGLEGSGTSPNYGAGAQGAWSYYFTGVRRGLPEGCTDPEDFEVGARNAAAPPWEGRLVPFGKPDPTLAEHNQRNQQVEKVLLTTRPYGASPVAGLLHDALEFLTLDDTPDEERYIGPQADPLVKNRCRQQAVILLTDGEPNLELRPYCEGAGLCPFDRSHEIAGSLAAQGIKVFVVGFAMANTTSGVDCKAMTDTDIRGEDGICTNNPDDRELQACCVMHRIAFEGGTQRAFFAEDQTALRSELDGILGEISDEGGISSRTRPAVAINSGGDEVAAYRFLSGFETEPGSLRSGHLVRQRYTCEEGEEYPTLPESGDGGDDEDGRYDASEGDDFAANLLSPDGAPRTFYTARPESGHFVRSLRPNLNLGDPDGLGNLDVTPVSGDAQQLVMDLSAAMPVNAGASNCASADGGSNLTQQECAQRILEWTVGLDNGVATPRTSLLGAIFRSTPRVVDYPNALTQDEAYERFASSLSRRPMVLYTSSNDGFLHAFKVRPSPFPPPDPDGEPADEDQVDELRNNELWAFLPPAVVPYLQEQYPGVYQRLLDGEPIVKDVVAEVRDDRLFLERSLSAGLAGETSYRTILVQSFGEGWPGYFALDISDPEAGPALLWQLTTAANGEPIFGSGGVPLITTVFVQGSGDTVGKEVAVAILPGGKGGSPTGSACARDASLDVDHIPGDFRPRTHVNCYPDSAKAARSITVVRLDSGEILRTFRPENDVIPASLRAAPHNMDAEAAAFESVTQVGPLDSPMTGRPVAFPSDVGAVADRVFLGDQDGGLWRLDVSAHDPKDWKLDLFFDAYAIVQEAEPGLAGQPIETPPILSLDNAGRITIAFSTGDQEALMAAGTRNYVWSLSEDRDIDNPERLKVHVNWYLPFEAGQRVTGPMVLLNEVLYFTTYTPVAAGMCGGDASESGSSHIYAAHYADPKDAEAPEQGPRMVPLVMGSSDSDPEPLFRQGYVSGISLMHLPSCYETPEEASLTSAYLPGYASRPRPQIQNPGLFQLTFHTGKTQGSDGAGGINADSVIIQPPAPVSRIESWAAIVD